MQKSIEKQSLADEIAALAIKNSSKVRAFKNTPLGNIDLTCLKCGKDYVSIITKLRMSKGCPDCVGLTIKDVTDILDNNGISYTANFDLSGDGQFIYTALVTEQQYYLIDIAEMPSKNAKVLKALDDCIKVILIDKKCTANSISENLISALNTDKDYQVLLSSNTVATPPTPQPTPPTPQPTPPSVVQYTQPSSSAQSTTPLYTQRVLTDIKEFCDTYLKSKMTDEEMAKMKILGASSCALYEKNVPYNKHKCIIYIRVSTHDQINNESMTAQLINARALAVKKDFAIKAIYWDCGISAGDMISRPSIQKLLEELSNGDAIIVASISRLSRDDNDLSNILHSIHAKNSYVIALDTGVETNNDSGRLMTSIYGIMAAQERQKVSSMVSAVMTAKINNGTLKTRPPYGWKSSGKSTKNSFKPLIPDDAEQYGIRLILEHYKANPDLNMHRFCQLLNKDGRIPKRGREWYQGTVENILKREGVYVEKRKVVTQKEIENGKINSTIYSTSQSADD